MIRHITYREFTMCKAALLAGLIGLAALLGNGADTQLAQDPEATPQVQIIPAAVIHFFKDCDDDTADTGVTL